MGHLLKGSAVMLVLLVLGATNPAEAASGWQSDEIQAAKQEDPTMRSETAPVVRVARVGSCVANSVPSSRDTVVIDGREYSSRDGLQVDGWECELRPDAGPVGLVFDSDQRRQRSVTPLATWGSSYAISTEIVQLYFSGKARAAANVYNGKRIIQVCIWYTRGGEMKSPKVCSTATSSGTFWSPGPEVTTGAWDSLNPWAPPTIFNISTVRIDPRVV